MNATVPYLYNDKFFQGRSEQISGVKKLVSHFQSGDSPLARRHNIGFRLAISACDLAPEATGLHDWEHEPSQEDNPGDNAADGNQPLGGRVASGEEGGGEEGVRGPPGRLGPPIGGRAPPA